MDLKRSNSCRTKQFSALIQHRVYHVLALTTKANAIIKEKTAGVVDKILKKDDFIDKVRINHDEMTIGIPEHDAHRHSKMAGK